MAGAIKEASGEKLRFQISQKQKKVKPYAIFLRNGWSSTALI